MTKQALDVERLSKTYASSVEALKDVNFSVADGDFFALLGPNGAGKSTLIGIVTSLVNKNSGKIKVFGYDLDTHLAKAKACIGVVPQEFNFHSFEKVEDIIIQQAGYYGIPHSTAKEHCHHYLNCLDIYDKRHVQARNLSGGMKRRLMIVRAIVHQPRLLILDEPTAGVDIELRRLIWRFLADLNKQGTTIILTTHYLEEAEQLCRKIAIIDDGKIIANTTMKQLLRNMNSQTYVLDLVEPVKQIPVSRNVDFKYIDDHTLEAKISNNQSLNSIFGALSRKNIEVSSMRTKGHRLEELFLTMTNSKA